jgi:hypothetical protein
MDSRIHRRVTVHGHFQPVGSDQRLTQINVTNKTAYLRSLRLGCVGQIPSDISNNIAVRIGRDFSNTGGGSVVDSSSVADLISSNPAASTIGGLINGSLAGTGTILVEDAWNPAKKYELLFAPDEMPCLADSTLRFCVDLGASGFQTGPILTVSFTLVIEIGR